MLITKYLSFFILAATKYFAAVLILFADSSTTVSTTFFILFFGGVVGVVVFYFLGKLINKGINALFARWKKNKTPKKAFTKNNRRLLFLKNKYGLIGIATLTPILLSIPLGCFLAARFYRKKNSTIFIMLLSVIVWTVVFSGIKVLLT